jgi:phage repressor protein C with HTH and peptisase S24 domain
MILKVLRISGESLSPEYRDGDYVVVSSFLRKPVSGDAIVFRNKIYGTMIKQTQSISESGDVFVIGSHPRSVDSRRFGSVNRKDVIGKVIWHIRKSEKTHHY